MRLPAFLFFALIVSTSSTHGNTPTPPTIKLPDKLPITSLAPSKLIPNLCVLKYRISTASPECQAFFDQALGYFYSYVWMEAARSFETAAVYDPQCPMVWWGLSRALERYGKGDVNNALKKADELKDRASHREQQLIQARMLERGLAPNAGNGEERKKKAVKTIDEMLALYSDDEEAWYYRAQLAGGSGLFGGTAGAVPFYKALLHVNPLHPGANHELVHFYEMFKRPALGWVCSEKYIESSPGIPHPHHMQSHLATRLGRWDRSAQSSWKAIEIQRAYHKELNVAPKDDHQFAHHLEILTLSLIHDGRYREARSIKAEAISHGFKHQLPWFRLHQAERDWDEAMKIAEQHRKTDKVTASYLSALVYLGQDDADRAASEIHVLEEAFKGRRSDKQLQARLWETQGLLMSQTGAADQGLKLIAKAVEVYKNDYQHHAWGNGAYYMEVWGLAALRSGKFAVAEEAFLEALAHDSGSLRGALGMQVICEKQNRAEECRRYADMARKVWKHAEVRSFDAELTHARSTLPSATSTAANDNASSTGGR